MKRLIATATAVLLATTISHSVFAHSHLGSSNPADGEVVTEPLNDITIEFDGQIEQGSFIDVTTASGENVEIQDLTIDGGTLTGTVAKPLQNGEYQVSWSIISADGHPLTGDFTFTVNAPVTKTKEEVTEQASETTGVVEENNQTSKAPEEATTDAVEHEEGSSSTTIMLIVLFIVFIAGGLFFFTKKRK